MAGDFFFARFPITLDLDDPADTVAQVGLTGLTFPVANFDLIMSEIVPMTGTGGKSKTVAVVFGRELV